jgi:hypothetical protein
MGGFEMTRYIVSLQIEGEVQVRVDADPSDIEGWSAAVSEAFDRLSADEIKASITLTGTNDIEEDA